MNTSNSPAKAALCAALLTLAACGGPDKPPQGVPGHVQGFAGAVAADEPRAAMAARDVLSGGGTAADAAVAAYFTLAVTLPASAGLSGGGTCIVYDPGKNKAEVLDFRPGSPAVPGNPRGMFALHAKYGKLRWENLLGAAESLARFGADASRATAADLAEAATARDPAVRQAFAAGEGRTWTQRDLSATLSRLRRAPGDLYSGPLAHEWQAAMASIGLMVSPDELRAFVPAWLEPARRPDGGDTVLSAAGAPAAGNGPSASFATLSGSGQSVACVVGMGGGLAEARLVPGLGVLVAPRAAAPAGPHSVANLNSKEPRVAAGAPTTEAAASAGRQAKAAGPGTGTVDGRANVVHCGSGTPDARRCGAATGTGGHGVAIRVGGG